MRGDADADGSRASGHFVRDCWRGVQHERQRPWPETGGKTLGERRQGPEPRAYLFDAGCDERNGLVRFAILDGEQARHGRRVERIGGEAVQRVGRDRRDAARAQHRCRASDRPGIGRGGIHGDAQHRG